MGVEWGVYEQGSRLSRKYQRKPQLQTTSASTAPSMSSMRGHEQYPFPFLDEVSQGHGKFDGGHTRLPPPSIWGFGDQEHAATRFSESPSKGRVIPSSKIGHALPTRHEGATNSEVIKSPEPSPCLLRVRLRATGQAHGRSTNDPFYRETLLAPLRSRSWNVLRVVKQTLARISSGPPPEFSGLAPRCKPRTQSRRDKVDVLYQQYNNTAEKVC